MKQLTAVCIMLFGLGVLNTAAEDLDEQVSNPIARSDIVEFELIKPGGRHAKIHKREVGGVSLSCSVSSLMELSAY